MGAKRTRVKSQEQMVGAAPKVELVDGRISEELAASLTRFFQRVVDRLNGGVSHGRGDGEQGNVDDQIVDVVTPASANTEFAVPHGLDRIAVGYELAGVDKDARVYHTSRGGWTESLLFLKCTASSAALRLRVY